MLEYLNEKLRIGIWLSGGAILLGLSLFAAYSVKKLSTESMNTIEMKEATDRGRHLYLLIHNELESLTGLGRSWAIWDDTYNFVENGNREYIKSNLDWKTSLTALSDIHSLYIVKRDGNLVWGGSYHPDLGMQVTPSAFPNGNWRDDPKWAELLRNGTKGLLNTENGLLFVVVFGIQPSEMQFEYNGYLIMGRFLDEKSGRRLGNLINGEIKKTDINGDYEKFVAEKLARNRVEINWSPAGDSIITRILQQTLLGIPIPIEVRTARKVFLEQERMSWLIFWTTFLSVFCMGIILFGSAWGYRLLDIASRRKLEGKVKEATAELRDAEKRWKLLIESAGNGILCFDTENNILYMNPMMEEMLGCKLEQAKGRPVHDVIHHQHLPGVECLLRMDMNNPAQKQILEDVIIKTGGGQINVSYTVAPILDVTNVCGAIAIFTDISERSRILEHVRESDSRFRAMFEKMNAAILVIKVAQHTENYSIMNANPACENILGMTRGQLMQKDLLSLFPYFQELGLQKILTRVSESGDAETVPVAFHDGIVKGWREGFCYRVGESEMVLILFDESTRMNSLNALEQSEERLKRFFEMPLIGACTISLSGQFKTVNPRLCEILGYSREALLQLTWMDRTPVEDLEQEMQKFKELIHEHGLGRYNTRTRMRHRAGHIVEIQISAMVVKNSAGMSDEVIAIMEDVTENTRIDKVMSFSVVLNQRADSNSEKDLLNAALIEAMTLTESDLAFVAKPKEDGKWIEINCIQRQPESNLTNLDLIVDQSHSIWAQCISTKRSVTLNELNEVSQELRKGMFATKIPINRVSLIPINENGHVSIVIGVGNKVSPIIPLDVRVVEVLGKNIQILMRRKMAEKALRASEERIRIMLDSIQTGVLLIDIDKCQIAYANPVALALFGTQKDVLVGSSCGGAICKNGKTYCKDCLEGKIIDNQEYTLVRSDGSLLPVLKTAAKITIDEKPFILESYVDISERKQYEIRISDAKDAAEAANRAKSSFLANMSHEIRTPLNSVLGMNSLLEQTHLDEEQMKCSQMIKSGAEALLKIVDNVLDLSKIEADRLQIEWYEFDLREIIDEITEQFSQAIKSKNLEYRIQFQKEMPVFFLGDRNRIRQILQNLVENAIKFTVVGFVQIEAKVQESNEVEFDGATFLDLKIQDSGIGMSYDTLSKLFAPFVQADETSTRKYGGAGIGLAICKRIIGLMNGTIEVASTEGVGSSFIVKIPLVPIEKEVRKRGSFIIESDDNNKSALLSFALSSYGYEKSQNSRSDVVAEYHEGISGSEYGNEHFLLRSTTGKNKASQRLGIPLQFREVEKTLASFVEDESPKRYKKELTDSQRILLVEDNFVNQKVAIGLLQKLKCDVDVVSNGQEAIDALAENDYALVFMDCQMPVMDGYEATRRIRKAMGAVRNPKIRIVAMTANALKGDRERCLECGMDDYLPKPITKDAVEAILDQWVKGGHSG